MCLSAAKLTSNLTVRQLSVQISSLADLAQASAYFGVPADSSIAEYFTSSLDKSALLLRPRMVEYKRTEDGVADVRRGKIAAFVTDQINALYFTQVSGRVDCSVQSSSVCHAAAVCLQHAALHMTWGCNNSPAPNLPGCFP
jgi:ABC-type amino acid transport substrate-binding protein